MLKNLCKQAPSFSQLLLVSSRRSFASSTLKAFATLDPEKMGPSTLGYNLLDGQWVNNTKKHMELVDPLNGGTMIKLPDTDKEESQAFIKSMAMCPKTGLHNPIRNKERYLMLAEVNRRVVEALGDPEVFNFFVRCLQKSCPKSTAQATGELKVTMDFFKNYTGDRVRFLAESKRTPGDHLG